MENVPTIQLLGKIFLRITRKPCPNLRSFYSKYVEDRRFFEGEFIYRQALDGYSPLLCGNINFFLYYSSGKFVTYIVYVMNLIVHIIHVLNIGHYKLDISLISY